MGEDILSENTDNLADTHLPSKSTKYQDVSVKDYSRTFNLCGANDRPDLRNAEYMSPTEHLNCPICQQPFFEPLTTVCGHTFCKDCIYECFKMSKRNQSEMSSGCCPLDRTPIDANDSNDLFPTPLVIVNLVDDLKVQCLNTERGCDWVGSRWELEHHVIADCGYTGVKCGGVRELDDPSEGEEVCEILVERRHLSDDNSCAHKLFQCEHCNLLLSKISENEHLSKDCLFNYQTCKLCGNDLIPLKNLEKHKDNCSKIGHMKCPAHEIGCEWVGTNQTSLEIHLQDNNCQLNQFLPFFKKMNGKVESLFNENQFLQKQINKILNLIIQGKITNLGYNESIEEINKSSRTEDVDSMIYLNYELERLKFEVDEKIIPFISENQPNERQPILNSLVNDNFILKEDLKIQRILINSLRKQVQFLLFNRGNIRTNKFSSQLDDLSDMLDVPSRSSSEERLNLKL
ncbi:uncharacterized protein PRCAT00000512001 [Priceomyces carsonii]|uniref:uncharacterized protein n=1 Tax=Priceomyces carsonii TaxID=28549 RepID=UPI002EDAE6E9|nr:unnamed protein product [Priceomyces carsonii]